MNKKAFVLFVSLQVLFLLSMAVYYYIIDDTGRILQLEAVPIDPLDIFYGEYVNLQYEIETIPARNWQGESDPENMEKVFVLLEQREDGIYELVSASLDKVVPLENQAVIAGRLEYYNEFEGFYEIDFGLNRYYIEENTGEQFTDQAVSLVVTVAVSGWGPNKIISVE